MRKPNLSGTPRVNSSERQDRHPIRNHYPARVSDGVVGEGQRMVSLERLGVRTITRVAAYFD